MGSIWNGFGNYFRLRETGVSGGNSVNAFFCVANFQGNTPKGKMLSWNSMINQYSYFNVNVVKFKGE